MGWGWRPRDVWIPGADSEEPLRREVPVKRFRCSQCSGDGCKGKRTWSYLPPLLLYLVRYAAKAVQDCWESWASGKSYEAAAEAANVRSVRTVKRWLELVTKRAEELAGEMLRLAGMEDGEVPPARAGPPEPSTSSPGKANRPRRLAAKTLLDLTLRLLDRLTLDPADQPRVAYHFAMKAARAL